MNAQQIKAMVVEVMGETWGDFAADTGCFPDDFTLHSGRRLSFVPGRWAHIVGAAVAQRLQAASGVPERVTAADPQRNEGGA